MALPDFLVIGAPKCGTTALHSALAAHPELYLSPVKEPKFFLTEGPPPDRGGGPGDVKTYREHVWRRRDYEALFADAPPGTLRGESTPFYLYDRDAQRRIRAAAPGARLIAVLRDPVERAHSNWTHLWSAGLDPIGDFTRACAAEDERIAAGWSQFWHYTRLGRYGEQLSHLRGLFPADQIHVLRYRSLIDSPAETLDGICRFLGVAAGVISEIPRENVTAHPKRSLRHSAVSRATRAAARVGRRLPGGTAGLITDRLEAALQRDGGSREPLTAAERAAVLPCFADDIPLLEQVTGAGFSDWLGERDKSGGLVGLRPAGQTQARNGRPREMSATRR